MKLIKKIAGFLTASGSPDRGFRIYTRCDRCGEKLSTRIDLYTDLTIRYAEGGGKDVYYTRKGIIGSGLCFEPIEVILTFDPKRNLVEKEISGGQFITAEEFEGE